MFEVNVEWNVSIKTLPLKCLCWNQITNISKFLSLNPHSSEKTEKNSVNDCVLDWKHIAPCLMSGTSMWSAEMKGHIGDSWSSPWRESAWLLHSAWPVHLASLHQLQRREARREEDTETLEPLKVFSQKNKSKLSFKQCPSGWWIMIILINYTFLKCTRLNFKFYWRY